MLGVQMWKARRPPTKALRLLLLLMMMMACAPSRHRVRLASATDLPGTVESVDRGSALQWYRKFPIVLAECQGRLGSQASAPASVVRHWCLATS